LLADFPYKVVTDDKNQNHYFFGETDVSVAIRTVEVTARVSEIAALPSVRSSLAALQRQFAKGCDSVFEGRDMGTVIFPKADLKIFLTARPEVRALRRFKELVDIGDSGVKAGTITVDSILKDINERDDKDSNREVAPLKQADDAIAIDTSDLTASQVTELIVTGWKASRDGSPKASKKASKNALSGFLKFSNEQRPQLLAANPSLTFAEIDTELGAMWQALSADEKAQYGVNEY